MDKDIEFYKLLEGLKKVKRFKPYEELQESVAGHCFMAIIIAKDILDNYNLNLDKNLVLDMLIYHDIVEVGMDFDFAANITAKSNELKIRKQQLEQEKIYFISEKFKKDNISTLFNMFEKAETREALFANLVDKLEASLYILSNNCAGFKCDEDYSFILQYTDKYVKHFPELEDLIKSIKLGLQEQYDKFKEKNKAD